MATDQTTGRREFEPLEPACIACREPRGTCFPGPCKAHIAAQAKADYYRDHPIKQAGEGGRAIFETAKAASDHSAFGDAWRTYEGNTGFRALPEHDRALIRVAFVAGWRAAAVSIKGAG